MTPEERQLLSGLFDRIDAASGAPRDREAEAFISEEVRRQPHAPYLMAQTVLGQQEALNAASARIQELEAKLAESARPTSFLGGLGSSLFGSEPRRTGSGVPAMGQGASTPQGGATAPGGVWGRGSVAAPQQPAFGGPAQQPYGQPYGQPGPWAGQAGPAGGGFLRSAMATAAGVAGGALLFNGIQSLMNSHGSGILPDASTLAGGGLSGAEPGLGSILAGTGLDDPNLMGSQSSHGPASSQDDTFDIASDFGDGGDMGGDGGNWA